MVKTSESAKHAYTYIPPSVQKTITQHMEQTMPGHLQKYQNSQGHMPEHIQASMAQHINKNLPGHMQKYVDPYLDRHVVNVHPGDSTGTWLAPSPIRPVSQAARVRGLSSNTQDNDLFSPDQPATIEPQNGPLPAGPPPPPNSNDPYGFIMNPQKPPRRPLSFSLSGGNTVQKAAVLGGGLIGLIILFSIASSFLNGANKDQQAKLMSLANTQNEIIRMADTASQNIKDKDLLHRAATVEVTVKSTKNDVLAALTARGKKVKDKEINITNPANDAVLTEGTQNGRYDDAYSQLLNKQLDEYKQLLQSVYTSGNTTEQALAVDATNQLKLLLPPAPN